MSKSAIETKPISVKCSTVSQETILLKASAFFLKYLQESDIVEFIDVQEQMEMKKNQEYLKMHKYEIKKNKDGYWRTRIPDETKPSGYRQIKRQTEDAVKKAVIAHYKKQDENPTIQELFEEWNDRELSLGNICESTHLRNQQTYNRHYKEFGKRRIKSVSEDEIREFLEEQVPKYKLTAKAFSNLKCITKGILKRARNKKLIAFSVEEMFYCLEVSKRAFKRIVKDDAEEVFSEIETVTVVKYLMKNLDIHNLGLLLLFLTGMRVGELVALRHEDFVDNAIQIRKTESRYATETGKQIYIVQDRPKTAAGVRDIVIPEGFEWVIDTVRKTNPFSEYVFMKNSSRMHTECFRKRLYRICDTLGISRRSPHKIRKTVASMMIDEGIGKRMILEMLGHVDINTTENHYHRNRQTQEEKSKILGGVFKKYAM